jgi:hypothetical protein
MARKLRTVLWSDADAKFTGAGNKWEGQELDDTLADIKDSTAFEDVKYTMSSNTYDCSNGNLQERTLSANGTLAIINVEAARYYTLIVKGNYTLTLPASEFGNPGATVPASTNPRLVTFLYDGTDYYFNYSTYTGT